LKFTGVLTLNLQQHYLVIYQYWFGKTIKISTIAKEWTVAGRQLFTAINTAAVKHAALVKIKLYKIHKSQQNSTCFNKWLLKLPSTA